MSWDIEDTCERLRGEKGHAVLEALWFPLKVPGGPTTDPANDSAPASRILFVDGETKRDH